MLPDTFERICRVSVACNPIEIPFETCQGPGILPCMVLEVLAAIQLSDFRSERRMR